MFYTVTHWHCYTHADCIQEKGQTTSMVAKLEGFLETLQFMTSLYLSLFIIIILYDLASCFMIYWQVVDNAENNPESL